MASTGIRGIALRTSRTMDSVQTPIIPLVGEWTRNTPGVLSLGQGMVSYPPPAAALEAVHEFGREPEHHHYGSATGFPPLLDGIKRKLLADNAIDAARGYQIMVTAGANMAFLNVLRAIVDPDDEVILPLPYYFNQEMAVRMLNCTPVCVPTRPDYQLDLGALSAAVSDRTRAIVTISPNNPSGAVYSEADLREVNALCREHGIYHICDEAYEYFTYEGVRHFSPGSIPGAEPYTISLYSLSKAYGFAGWRIGYAVFPEDLLPALLKVQDTNLICPPLVSQYAAAGALTAGSAYCKNHLRQMADIRTRIVGQVQSVRGLCRCSASQGAFYLLLKLNTDKTDLSVVKTLIDDFGIVAIPGSAFGLTEGCYLRLSYGMLDPGRTGIAMQRLIQGLQWICG
ncbi:MAG: pyridoxal phosphate-dependent aminotransferase [Gammaproteobacteria bacterium]